MKKVVIHDCPQLSPEWWELHRGKVTGSSMNRIITPAKRLPSTQQRGLIAELVGQLCSPHPMDDGDGYVSRAMAEGMRREPEARRWYAMDTDLEVERVGFIVSECGRMGVSPDGLIGIDGGLELKCPTPKTHAEYLLEGALPLEYYGQVHGSLLVTGRAWWDFVSYCHGMEPFRLRVQPDDFTAALAAELLQFFPKLDAALLKVRGR